MDRTERRLGRWLAVTGAVYALGAVDFLVRPWAAVATLERVAERGVAAGLIPRWGRKVLELRPPIQAHKGTAIRRLLAERGVDRALYAGDDTTDLDVFAALDGLEVAIRVAVASPEAPSRLGEAADLVVDGPAELLELLRRL